MTEQRSIPDAEKALAEAQDLVVEQGGIIHEDAKMDAAEAALDGQPKQFLADIISGKTKGPYKPKGGWSLTVGRN
jgi:hypothetical protein